MEGVVPRRETRVYHCTNHLIEPPAPRYSLNGELHLGEIQQKFALGSLRNNHYDQYMPSRALLHHEDTYLYAEEDQHEALAAPQSRELSANQLMDPHSEFPDDQIARS